MRIRNSIKYLFVAVLLCSCSTTKQIAYFQDLQPDKSWHEIVTPLEIKIRPEDKISILVNSKDPLLADLFNLPIVSRQIGQNNLSGYAQGLSGYTVNAAGKIDFPVLGEIYVAGKSRSEIAAHIKNELITQDLVKDPVITVEFMNLTISVLGEVQSPGRYNIVKDKITLLDALSLAGDLTIYGRRENVLVIREEHGVQTVYKTNLCSAADLYASSAYYLQQNDVVYVEPNSTRSRQSTVNGNNIRSTSFWISLTSLLTTICVLIFK